MCGIIRIWFVLQTSTSFFYGLPGKCFVCPSIRGDFILVTIIDSQDQSMNVTWRQLIDRTNGSKTHRGTLGRSSDTKGAHGHGGIEVFDRLPCLNNQQRDRQVEGS